MAIFLILIFNSFFFSFQGIPTALFCDDVLKEIYVVDGSNVNQIEYGKSGGGWQIPHIYPE